MSNTDGAPPPYPGGYSNPSDYSAFPPPGPGYAPPPQPYAPYKDGGGTYSNQSYGPPLGQTHGSTVVVTQPPVTLVQIFRESPVRTRCNHCQAEVITAVHFETGTFTWVICFVLWLVGCGIGCCLIPFCVDGCKDVIHSCPNCNQLVGRYSRM